MDRPTRAEVSFSQTRAKLIHLSFPWRRESILLTQPLLPEKIKYTILFGNAFMRIVFVLPDTKTQIIGYTDIERSIFLVCRVMNVVGFHCPAVTA